MKNAVWVDQQYSSASIPFNYSGTDVPLSEGASDRLTFQGSVFGTYISQVLEPDGFNLPHPYVLGLATSISGQLDKSELLSDPNIITRTARHDVHDIGLGSDLLIV